MMYFVSVKKRNCILPVIDSNVFSKECRFNFEVKSCMKKTIEGHLACFQIHEAIGHFEMNFMRVLP